MDTKYTQQIKDIVYEYYNRGISQAEYREQRSQIIDAMDKEFNGADYTEQNSWVDPLKLP